MCFFPRLNSLDVQIQVYFTLRTVTVGSHVFDMLSGVSLSLAKKRVDASPPNPLFKRRGEVVTIRGNYL